MSLPRTVVKQVELAVVEEEKDEWTLWWMKCNGRRGCWCGCWWRCAWDARDTRLPFVWRQVSADDVKDSRFADLFGSGTRRRHRVCTGWNRTPKRGPKKLMGNRKETNIVKRSQHHIHFFSLVSFCSAQFSSYRSFMVESFTQKTSTLWWQIRTIGWLFIFHRYMYKSQKGPFK
jgi:hypothetical protein